MAPGLHGPARTTPRVRAELQRSREATRALAARHGLNPKTVAEWRRRTSTADARMGPSRPRSPVLTEAEEAIVVEFRRRTLLPRDDVLGRPREAIPTLSRSAPHRCLQRHGISRLPRDPEKASRRGRFAETRIGGARPPARGAGPGGPHRRLRAAPQRGQALHVPRDRPRDQVRPRRLPRRQHEAERCRLPARGRGRLPLPAAHGAHGQRDGLRRPAREPRPLSGDRGRLRRPHLRPGLRRARHRAPAHQTPPTTRGPTARPSG
jgi:hypothetical protein